MTASPTFPRTPADPRPLALVTGASRGIGAAVARLLAADHDLLLLGRDTSALADVAAELCGAWPDSVVRTAAAELTDEHALARAVTRIDRLDVLVHCAGVAELGRIEQAPLAQWRAAYEVNVLGVVLLTQHLLPALRLARGHVVAINSGAGLTAKAGWGAYSASKFALRAVTDTLRAEEPELRVTSIHPGRVDTAMQRAIVADEGGTYTPEQYLSPASVAGAVRDAVRAPRDAHPTELVLRPRGSTR